MRCRYEGGGGQIRVKYDAQIPAEQSRQHITLTDQNEWWRHLYNVFRLEEKELSL